MFSLYVIRFASGDSKESFNRSIMAAFTSTSLPNSEKDDDDEEETSLLISNYDYGEGRRMVFRLYKIVERL